MKFARLLLAAGVVLASTPCRAATWNVPGDSSTIQGGVDLAATGDTVLVEDGEFTGVGNRDIDFHGKEILLVSRHGAESTVIDCEFQGRGFLFVNGEGSAARIEGVTVLHGDPDDLPTGGGVGSGTERYGGAVLVLDSDPTFLSCTFRTCGDPDDLPTGGEADTHGGAAYVIGGAPSFVGCLFDGNGGADGGAVGCRGTEAIFRGCTFRENLARGAGGAIYLDGESEVGVDGCAFIRNEVRSGYAATGIEGAGGALYAYDSLIKLQSCAFHENAARDGGAVCAVECEHLDFADVDFLDNTAVEEGGALRMERSSVSIFRSLLARNHAEEGGGLFLAGGSLKLEKTTVAENDAEEGGGIYCERGKLRAESAIIALSVSGGALHCAGPGCEPAFSCSDIWGNAGGDWVDCISGRVNQDGNIREDPLFCFSPSLRYYLAQGSPCLEDNGLCDGMGAFGGGCITRGADLPEAAAGARGRSEPTSWGTVKSLFR